MPPKVKPLKVTVLLPVPAFLLVKTAVPVEAVTVTTSLPTLPLMVAVPLTAAVVVPS
ncbi:hypothetical protein AGMMS4956_21210 [Bacteroidia bacterium]|nr:hypothetical protein AGMMS4956_21210 [Bacteroidia bacterium]